MKKLILFSIAVLSIAFITPAFAGFGDTINSNDSAKADAFISTQDNRVYEGSEAVDLPAPAGEVNYPGAPNMFGGATPSYMDRLKIKDIKMVKKSRIPADYPMAVFYSKQANMQSLGTITVVSDSKKSIGPDVFAEIVIKAHELGAVALHVKAEGFQRLVRNEGAGIGFTWTGTSVGNSGTVSAQTGVMGFGKSWGEAGYFDHPFIVVHALFPKGFNIGDARNANGNILDWLKD